MSIDADDPHMQELKGVGCHGRRHKHADGCEPQIQSPRKMDFDWKRIFFILLGLAFFFTFYFMNELAGRGGSRRQALSPAVAGQDGHRALSDGGGVVDFRGHAHRRHRHRHRPFSGRFYDPAGGCGPEGFLRPLRLVYLRFRGDGARLRPLRPHQAHGLQDAGYCG